MLSLSDPRVPTRTAKKSTTQPRVNVTAYTNMAVADAAEEDGKQGGAANHTVFLASMNQSMGCKSAWRMHVTAGTAKLSMQMASVFEPFSDDSHLSSTRPCMHCSKRPDEVWTPFRVVIPQTWGAARFNKQKMLFGNWCCASCAKGWFSERQKGPVLAQCLALIDARCVDLGISIQTVAPPSYLMFDMGGPVRSLKGAPPDTSILTYQQQYLPMSVLIQMHSSSNADSDMHHVFGENGGSPENLKPPPQDKEVDMVYARCKSVVQELQTGVVQSRLTADKITINSPFATTARKNNARCRLTDVTKGAVNTRAPPPLAPSTVIIESTAAAGATMAQLAEEAAVPAPDPVPVPAPAPASVPVPVTTTRTEARRVMDTLFSRCVPDNMRKKKSISKKRQSHVKVDSDEGKKPKKRTQSKLKKRKRGILTVLQPK